LNSALLFSFYKMALSVSGSDKDQYVTALAALILADSSVDITADNLNAVIDASGNKVPAYYAVLYSTYIEKAGGVSKFLSGPSAGGGGAGNFF
jgi:large subunit ribosomal protein LP1